MRNGAPVAFAVDTLLPWVTLHDTTDVPDRVEAPLLYELSYDVALGLARRVAIPIIQPSRALDARTAAVEPKVRLTVTSTVDPVGAPEFPRFRPAGASAWSTATIAVPASVVIRGREPAGASPCDDAIRSPGTNGGFPWRFAAFVGTLVLWIPLYFAWATRRQRGDDAVERDA
jgi:hypothetical protein